jgi:type IV secretion system protein VirB1
MRLSPKLTSLAIGGSSRSMTRDDTTKERSDNQLTQPVPNQVTQTEETASWNVFRSRRHSSVVVFHNDQSEQSE